MSKTLNLYYVAADDANGDNFDLFTWANAPAQAYELWAQHYHEGNDHDFTGILSAPLPSRTNYDHTSLIIYEVPLSATTAAPLVWGDDVKIVAWMEQR